MVRRDSHLVASHINKSYQVRYPDLVKFLVVLRAMEHHFLGVTVKTIPRVENAELDTLTKAANMGKEPPINMFFKVLANVSILPNREEVAHVLCIGREED